MSKILFLEDDALFAESVIDFLEEEGYEVHYEPNGQGAIEATYKNRFDLYLLDINVPLIDGMRCLKELRESDDETPAIFLTSHKEREILKDSFLIGADDFITKPFDIDELLLRIEALLRRNKKHQCIKLLCHDQEHKRILYDSKEVDLTKKEYELLLVLMQHVNQVVPRELMIEELWSCSEGGSSGAIRVYINRIKQLIPSLQIENIRGIGYKLVS